jgi:VanZ family protein
MAVAIAVLSLSEDGDSVKRGFDLFAWISKVVTGTEKSTDKFAHLFAYAALSGAAVLGFRRRTGLLLLTLVLLMYGAFLEAAQSFTTIRSASMLDFIANALGVASGTVGALIFRFVFLRTRP